MINLRKLLAVCFLFLGSVTAAQEVQVSVDRNEVARGETLIFTIRVYDQRQGMQLDLTPLTEDFDVLGTRTSSQIRSINGVVDSWTDYIVTLFPLNEGELLIPSLQVNDTVTNPIIVTVINAGPRSNQSSEELFLEIEVNKETIYVQEQLLFTVRLYYTINGIRNPQFTELEMPNTVIQLIGSPNQYEKLIDGNRYGVYEKRYVIFPQRSGALEIPDILFRGEVTDGSSNFVFRNLNTRRVTAFIEGITIDVQERPAAVRNSDWWLPVSKLTLEESWNVDISTLRVGDTAVRTVTMVADGLDGAVLPPFSAFELEGVNVYPDPADIQRTFVEGAIVGTRVESTTIVPTASGTVQIPQILVPWWNINSNQLEAAIVPATRLVIATVEGVVPAEQTVASTADLEQLLAATPVVDQAMIDAQNEAEFIEVDSRWLDFLIALAFIIVAFAIYALVIDKHKREITAFITRRKILLAAKFGPENNEGVAFNQLKRSCRGRNLNDIREKLIRWCDHFLESRSVLSMEDILRQQEASSLHSHAHQIQSGLFSSTETLPVDSTFNGKALIKLISALRRKKLQKNKHKARNEKYALPPLYKTC